MSVWKQLLGSAALDVLKERERQIREEGWDAAHDDLNNPIYTARLIRAAAAYTITSVPRQLYACDDPPFIWPWHSKWWKPTTPRRNLVKAAALILAAIEQIDREASGRKAWPPKPPIDAAPAAAEVLQWEDDGGCLCA